MASARLSVPQLAEALERGAAPIILDASWHMPATGRQGHAEYLQGHIPGARFFDLDAIADQASPYPHMLPPPAQCAARFGALGLRETDEVAVYDTAGLFSAARAWWMLRAMGHRGAVRVLEGGLPAWRAAGMPLEAGESAITPAPYHAMPKPELLADWRQVEETRAQGLPILDARSPSRFAGAEPEPRPGLRAGHIPGSANLHYARLLDAQGVLRSDAELNALFAEAGGAGQGPLTLSCGSGVTACILALAAHEIGRGDVRVYDGSWAEWGSRPDLPVATG